MMISGFFDETKSSSAFGLELVARGFPLSADLSTTLVNGEMS
jgi:hypothetical protein